MLTKKGDESEIFHNSPSTCFELVDIDTALANKEMSIGKRNDPAR